MYTMKVSLGTLHKGSIRERAARLTYMFLKAKTTPVRVDTAVSSPLHLRNISILDTNTLDADYCSTCGEALRTSVGALDGSEDRAFQLRRGRKGSRATSCVWVARRRGRVVGVPV